MKKIISLFSLAAMFTVASCTNLDEEVYGVLPKAGFGSTPDQLAALLGPAYSNLRGYTWGFHNVEVTTDVGLVPTRGGDWYDGGNWLNYSRHTWSTSHGPINDLWGYIYEGGINTINQLIPQVAGNTAAISELRAVRAFYYFLAMDTFGNVPLITETSTGTAKTAARSAVYDFVVKELTESLPNLPAKAYGRMTKDAANALLAKVYLGAGVYKGSPEWQKAADAASAVISSGNYSLTPDFLANFAVANEGSKENIWAIPMDKIQGGGINFAYRTLHYESQSTYNLSGQPWNGFCTLGEFYNTFDAGDARRKMFIEGPQFAADGKTRLKDALGQPLSFNVAVVKDFMTAADLDYQGAGTRLGKYEIQRGNSVADQDNDWVMLRLGDVYLMRAEANFRLGKAADALTDLNLIRSRAGVAAFKAADVTADNILAERGRELAWEGWRRSDLIRFGEFNKVGGKFTSKFMKEASAKTLLFPIPQQRLDSNPGLTQNPGY